MIAYNYEPRAKTMVNVACKIYKKHNYQFPTYLDNK